MAHGTPETALRAWVRALPKVEHHLHLEGSVRPRTLLELAPDGASLPLRREGDGWRYVYRDFLSFLEAFRQVLRALSTPEAFRRVARELVEDLAAEGVLYAEAMLSAAQYVAGRAPLPLEEVLDAVLEGFEEGARIHGVRVRLILDYGRQYGLEGALEVLERAAPFLDRGVVGFSIGGDEIHFPPEPFAPAFRRARALGLGLAAHAGEVAGPESVRGAVETLGVRRVGHGIRVAEDPGTLELLRARRVVLEVCPTSNLRTGAVNRWPDHPLPRLWKAGVPLTLHTDDPALFGVTLSQEMERAVVQLGLPASALPGLLRNAVDALFLPEAERGELRARLEEGLARVGPPPDGAA